MASGRKAGLVAAVLAALGGGWYLRDRGAVAAGNVSVRPLVAQDAAQAAFDARAKGRIITLTGTVERTLADDRDGSPHQRFIVRTARGLSVLIAHNLDLAPRLDGLKAGDVVTVLGEYEWNEKGGVMHWTHDDPKGQHVAGYIEWRGKRYQ